MAGTRCVDPYLAAIADADIVSPLQGVGHVVAIGAHTQNSPVKLGDRVGIKWLAYSCLDCELCRKGLEQSASDVIPPALLRC